MAKKQAIPHPWLRWAPAEFYADPAVIAMTQEQRWRYRDSLDSSWMTDTPGEASESQWRRWLGVTPARWPEVRDAYAAAFVVVGDNWVQKRLLAEFQNVMKNRHAKAESGRKSAAARAQRSLNER